MYNCWIVKCMLFQSLCIAEELRKQDIEACIDELAYKPGKLLVLAYLTAILQCCRRFSGSKH